jgi:hypothetical protein
MQQRTRTLLLLFEIGSVLISGLGIGGQDFGYLLKDFKLILTLFKDVGKNYLWFKCFMSSHSILQVHG